MFKKRDLVVGFLVVLISLNLSWAHQTILIVADRSLNVTDYYHFASRAPFIYRALPALAYRVLMFGRTDIVTGLNEPFSSSASIFQLLVDSVSLVLTLVFMEKIAHALNPTIKRSVTLQFASLALLAIVVFGFFMVPNRAVFYPYDFPDMFFGVLILYLSIQLKGRAEFLLPVAIIAATLNKETSIFYAGVYLALRATDRATWKTTAAVLVASGGAVLLARSLVILLVRQIGAGAPAGNDQYEVHVLETLAQLRNPLFLFAMLNVCSYFYVAVLLLRRKLDRQDGLILGLIAAWVALMAIVGVVRELRVFVPATLLMFVIVARHLGAIADDLMPGATWWLAGQQARETADQTVAGPPYGMLRGPVSSGVAGKPQPGA